MSIFIIANVKGGTGKSFLSTHVVLEHVFKKNRQKKVVFSAICPFIKDYEKSLINSSIIKKYFFTHDQIEDEIFKVLYAARYEDVIIDIGSGDLLDDVLEYLSTTNKKLIFIIPQGNDAFEHLQYTIRKIEHAISNSKIMIVHNMFYNQELKECQDFKKYTSAKIPHASIANHIAIAEQKSMSELYYKYLLVKDIHKDGSLNILDNSELIKWRKLYSVIDDFYKDCEDFFNKLQQLEEG